MICKQCGKEIPEGSKYCGYCSAPADSVQPVDNITDRKSGKKKYSFLKWLLLIPAFIAVVLIVAVISSRAPGKIVIKDKPSKLFDMLDNTTDIPRKKAEESEREAAETMEETKPQPEAQPEPSSGTDPAQDETVPDASDIPEPKNQKIRRIRVSASSTSTAKSKDGQTYEAEHLIDGDYTTAWLEGRDDEGIGESLLFTFDGKHRICKLIIYNGFLKTEYRYTINGKVTKLLAEFDDGSSKVIDLDVMHVSDREVSFSPDDMNPTVVVFDQPVETETMKLTILDAVAGTKYKDTSMSEIEVYE